MVITQHAESLPGSTLAQTGVPSTVHITGNSVHQIPVAAGNRTACIVHVHISAGSDEAAILKLSVESSSVYKVDTSIAAQLVIFDHSGVTHFCSFINGG